MNSAISWLLLNQPSFVPSRIYIPYSQPHHPNTNSTNDSKLTPTLRPAETVVLPSPNSARERRLRAHNCAAWSSRFLATQSWKFYLETMWNMRQTFAGIQPSSPLLLLRLVPHNNASSVAQFRRDCISSIYVLICRICRPSIAASSSCEPRRLNCFNLLIVFGPRVFSTYTWRARHLLRPQFHCHRSQVTTTTSTAVLTNTTTAPMTTALMTSTTPTTAVDATTIISTAADADAMHDASGTSSSTKSFATSANDAGDCCLLAASNCDDNDDDRDDVVGQSTSHQGATDIGGGGHSSDEHRRNGVGEFVCDDVGCNYRGKTKKALTR